jgi:hypothetical protein
VRGDGATEGVDWATDDDERLAKDQIFRHQGCRPNHR